MEHLIPACSGKRIDVKQGQMITVIDPEGDRSLTSLRRQPATGTSSFFRHSDGMCIGMSAAGISRKKGCR